MNPQRNTYYHIDDYTAMAGLPGSVQVVKELFKANQNIFLTREYARLVTFNSIFCDVKNRNQLT